MNSTLTTEINNYLISPFLINISSNKVTKQKLIAELNNILKIINAKPVKVNATPIQPSSKATPPSAPSKVVVANPVNKSGGSKRLVDALINAHELAQELSIKTKSNIPEHNFFKDMDKELLKFTSQVQRKMHENPTISKDKEPQTSSNVTMQKKPESAKEIDDFMKVLVNSIGKDSPNSLQAQGDLRTLLKKYPNKVPEAIVQVIIAKIRKNGLGVIFAVQTMSTLLALLIGLIPIPGIAVVADMIIGGTDAFIDGFVALGPENITDLISNGVDNAMKTITRDLLPIFKETATIMANTMSGVFCCNKSQQKEASQNMDKYADVLVQMIKLINAGPSKNAEVESFVRELQDKVIKTKKINTVDMNALDKILNKTDASKESKESKESKSSVGGGKKKTTHKSRRKMRRNAKRKTRRNHK